MGLYLWRKIKVQTRLWNNRSWLCRARNKTKHKKCRKKYYHIVGEGYSNYAFDWFFKVRDRYESIIDPSTLNPVEFIREVNEGNTSFKQNYHFNQSNQTVFDGEQEVTTPKNIQDMVSCYFYARNLDLKSLKKEMFCHFQHLLMEKLMN